MELIVSQFHTNKVPTTGLSPVVNIRLSDGAIVKTAEAMTEVGGGWYSYEFAEYNKKQTYLIDTDGGSSALDDRCQNVTNTLDAYDNKKDWKGGGGGSITNNIDTKKLAEDVWNVSKSKLERGVGTIGKHISDLDTKEILVKIDEIEIPDYSEDMKSLGDKSEDLKKGQEVIKGSIKEQGEMVVKNSKEITETVIGLGKKTELQSEGISSKIDVVGKAVNDLPTFDYKRVENYITDNFSNLPIVKQIEDLKEDLKQDIAKGNKSDLKDYVLKSLENQQIYERQLADTELQKEFTNSLTIIGQNLDTLSKKEIDFSTVYKDISELSQTLQKGISENSLSDREEYRKSMKYIVYIAKNIGAINKKDLNEIKETLSIMKK